MIEIGIIILGYTGSIFGFSFFYMLICSIYDIRKREIPSYILFSFPIPALALVGMLYFYRLFDLRSYLVSITIAVMIFAIEYVLYKKCLVGAADPWFLLAAGILMPWYYRVGNTYLPAIIAAIIFSIIPLALSIIYNFVVNMRRIKRIDLSRASIGEKIYYMLLARIASGREIKKKKYYFILYGENITRISARVCDEPFAYEKAIEENKYYVASYAYPLALYILIGSIISLPALQIINPNCLTLSLPI